MLCNSHSVHIYSESRDLILNLAGIVTSSLVTGNAVLIVATREHQKHLIKELVTTGIDVQRYIDDGMYATADAAETLSRFMCDNMPVAELFRASVGQLLVQVRQRTRSKDGGFTVFGEMVALLWEQGNQAAALRLEELWNEVLQEMAFRLHCGYPKRAFSQHTEEAAVAALHSYVMTDRKTPSSVVA